MHFTDAKGILTGSGRHLGMNIYRGCTHGCIYCDSRSRCYGFTHAFEDIEVKRNAPELLEKALKSKRRKCMIATGAMSAAAARFAEPPRYGRMMPNRRRAARVPEMSREAVR